MAVQVSEGTVLPNATNRVLLTARYWPHEVYSQGKDYVS